MEINIPYAQLFLFCILSNIIIDWHSHCSQRRQPGAATNWKVERRYALQDSEGRRKPVNKGSTGPVVVVVVG